MKDYIMTDTQADNLIEEINELKAEKEKFRTIAMEKIDYINNTFRTKADKIDGEVQFKKDQLAAFFLTVNKRDSKTQQSYSLLSGKLVMKKATTKLTHDNDKLMDWCQTNASEYINQSIINRLDWKAFKSNLDIVGNKIVSNNTGEIMDIDGLSIEEVAAQFDIK